MFYSKAKNNALEEHKKAVDKYNSAFSSLEKSCKALYEKRTDAVALLEDIESLINSIANTPKEFEKDITTIKANKKNFKVTENYAREASKTLTKSSINTAAGVAGGAAVASLVPLAGTAATNAALVSLFGGGAIASGAGIAAGGSALLALAGPIGWGIAGVTTTASAFFVGRKNKKTAEEAQEATKNILSSANQLKAQNIKVNSLNDKTHTLLANLNIAFKNLSQLNGLDYLSFSDDEKLQLGSLVNNANTLSTLLNKTIG